MTDKVHQGSIGAGLGYMGGVSAVRPAEDILEPIVKKTFVDLQTSKWSEKEYGDMAKRAVEGGDEKIAKMFKGRQKDAAKKTADLIKKSGNLMKIAKYIKFAPWMGMAVGGVGGAIMEAFDAPEAGPGSDVVPNSKKLEKKK